MWKRPKSKLAVQVKKHNKAGIGGGGLLLPLDQTQPRKSQPNDGGAATPVFLHRPQITVNIQLGGRGYWTSRPQ